MEYALTFDDVLLKPAYNHYMSRKDVDISMKDKLNKLQLKIPIFTSNMDTITEWQMARWIESKGGAGVIHRFMNIEEGVEQWKKSGNTCFMSVGCSEAELKRVEAYRDIGVMQLCVDVAHAHAKYVGKMIKFIRNMHPNACIMAGNVATHAGADYLASKGADIIKVGLGSGSCCTTRIKTGFGVPQLTAIQDCARVDRSIVADGGIKTPADIVKALAFGADFVMLGGMLSGTHYTPGEILYLDKHENETYNIGEPWIQQELEKGYDYRYQKVKTYRGMASKEVADDYLGGLTEWKTSEGISTTVPYKNEKETEFILADIIGGLRSGMTYSGAATIKELQRKLQYTIITQNGRDESMPHILNK